MPHSRPAPADPVMPEGARPQRGAAILGGIASLLVAALIVETALGSGGTSVAGRLSFFFHQTGWDVSSSLLPQNASDPYWYTFLIGIGNTVIIFVITAFLATLLGAMVGLAAVSQNYLLSRSMQAYIALFRSIPLAIQILLAYAMTRQLPRVREAYDLGFGIALSNKGIHLPSPGHIDFVVLAAAATGALAWLVRRKLKVRATEAAEPSRGLTVPIVAAALLGGCVTAALLPWSIPQLSGFNFRGGITVQPEFLAIIAAITIYGTAFVAEIIRAGILGVPIGQMEAGLALGLSRRHVLHKVILPQSLRLIVPSMINQYIYIAKAATFGSLIGVADFFAVSAITINQKGYPLEVLSLFAAGYIMLAVIISSAGNWFNNSIALRGTER